MSADPDLDEYKRDIKADVLISLEHDARQPQHSIDMGLRAIRLALVEIAMSRKNESRFDSLLQRVSSDLDSLQAAARQVFDIQQDLFDSIRLDLDRTPPLKRIISAGEVIDRVCSSNRSVAPLVEIRAVRSNLTFPSDERWVERSLNNLLVNALKHSGGTKILCGARRRGGDIVFEVRDNGRGMDPEQARLAVDPSTRSHAKRSETGGLGLCNVNGFAKRLGGSVAWRTSPGLGTTVQLRLPGPIGRLDSPPGISRSHLSLPARERLVVILDDELSALRATARAFEDTGFIVYSDHDPLRWLSFVTELVRRPDLVVIDFNLNGHDCELHVDIVRKRWGSSATNVVVYSGDTWNPAFRRISAAVPVMTKPINDAKLALLADVALGKMALPSRGLLA